ncbi:hypothetical protein AAVH_11268 [Aphelenchoides avenae]|nr:hypothetical protein AAVH_11268 [Aphelenchus avenae]
MTSTLTEGDHVSIEMEQLLAECSVCSEGHPLDDFVRCSPAAGASVTHTYCKACVVLHVEATLNDFTLLSPDASGLRCMDPECSQAIVLDELRLLLEPAVLERLEKRIAEDCKDVLHCKDGRQRLRLEYASSLFSEGPAASTVPSAEPTSSSSDGYRRLEEKFSNIFIRHCPHCRRALTKSLGCSHVKCPCGTHLCFVCNGVLTKSCGRKCDEKLSMAQDRAALKKVYDEATSEQRAHLRSIHHGIESYGSLRYKVRDYFKEHVNHILASIVCIVIFIALQWFLSLFPRVRVITYILLVLLLIALEIYNRRHRR